MASRDDLQMRLADPAPLLPTSLYDLALDALELGLFEEIVARVEAALAASGGGDARLLQVLGLARRGMLDGPEGLAAFSRAAALAPGDALIAHSHARSALEAGRPATELYRRAMALAPRDAGVLLGHAAALVAEGNAEVAERAMAEALRANPGWYEGHLAYARLVAAGRLGDDGTSTARAALRLYPDDAELWRVLLRLLMDARRYGEAGDVARAAVRRLGASHEWRRIEAISLGEAGEIAAAQEVFDALPSPRRAADLIHPARNLIRLSRFDEAAMLAERPFAADEETVLWPYRALLWRLRGDPRWEWLEGVPQLIGVYDLDLSAAQIAAAADMLRDLHRNSGELVDQSVRGGTQTDGPLFARAEPEIRMLRDALMAAAAAHIARLPPPQLGHPTLIERRTPVRAAGSWSVRLSGAGFHVDHVHSQGWLSSAFYVALPPVAPLSKDGWLTFGECRALVPELEGFHCVEPKVGRLALFPSTMWHGTRPFAAGERISVAFDIARP